MSTQRQEATRAAEQSIIGPMVVGFMLSRALYEAVEMGVFDELADGSLTATDLADRLDADSGALYRLLRALASFGLLREDGESAFHLTEVGSQLRRNAPHSMSRVVHPIGNSWEAWSHLGHSLRTGKSAFEHATGSDYFSWLTENESAGRQFDESMRGFVLETGHAMTQAVDLDRFRTIVDVGGGTGGLLATLLHTRPSINGVLFDLPSVVERAKPLLAKLELTDRCTCVGGDFFGEVPTGGDAYLLVSVLHDWNDEKALAILRACRKAMRPGSTLLIAESLIRPGNDLSFAKIMDLHMLVLSGGRQRSEAELRTLLDASGFDLRQVTPLRTSAETSIVEAAAAPG